jgi:multiple sugar transport system permease protein
MTRNSRKKVLNLFVSAVVLMVGVFMFVPFLYMFSSSMRTPAEAFKLPPAILPERFMYENYISLFTSDIPFLRMFLNSTLVTSITIGGQIFICTMAAYAIAKINFRGANVWFVSFLLAMMIPIQAIIIPIYIMLAKVNLVNTLSSLIIPSLFNAFGIFILKQSIASVPNAIVEAAKIDGAGHFRICWKIIVPVIKSSLVTMVILNFNTVWNDYFMPYVFVSKWEKMTVPLGVAAMKGYMGSGNKSVVLAGVSVAIMPILVIFLIAQKHIVEGLTSSSVKG